MPGVEDCVRQSKALKRNIASMNGKISFQLHMFMCIKTYMYYKYIQVFNRMIPYGNSFPLFLYLPLSLLPHQSLPHISHFPFIPLVLYHSLLCCSSLIPPTWFFLTFLISAPTQGYILTPEVLELGTSDQKHVMFVFLGLGYLSKYDLFQFQTFVGKIRDFIFLHS